MKFRVALPGTQRIPPANDHVPAAENWTFNLQAPEYQRLAAAIDELGFDAITVPEHFAMPYEEVPRLGPYWMHALSAMAFIAGATRRVRVDATVFVLPYHHPLDMAKSLSTIDVLSGGRLNVSIGVGHAVAEFKALGVPFEERGARTDEILDAMKILWTEDEPVFHGRYYDIEGLAFEPKPIQQPRPPIYVGGNSNPALRRAARHEGWQPNPTTFSLEEIPERLDYIHRQPEFAGKEDTFDVSWVGSLGPTSVPPQLAGASPQQLTAYRDQLLERFQVLRSNGVTTASVVTPSTRSADEYLDHLRWFAAEVAPQAKD
jgi:probable F420-dependent oxidoreductase